MVVGGLCTVWCGLKGRDGRPRHQQSRPRAAVDGAKPCGLHQSFGRLVVMVLNLVLVAHHLPVEFVDEFVHRSIQVFM